MYRETPASAKPKHPVLTLFLYVSCEDLFLQYRWNHLSSEVILSLPWLLLQTLRTVRNDAFWALDMIIFFLNCIFFFSLHNWIHYSSLLTACRFSVISWGCAWHLKAQFLMLIHLFLIASPNINQLLYHLGGCNVSMSHGMQLIFILPLIGLMQLQ